MMITGRTAGEDLGALEDVLHAVGRVYHVALRQVVPHVAVLVVPSNQRAIQMQNHEYIFMRIRTARVQ